MKDVEGMVRLFVIISTMVGCTWYLKADIDRLDGRLSVVEYRLDHAK